MAANNIVTSGGVGFTGLLFITFLVLKLTNVIDWSWWWVTAPLWGGFALLGGICVLIGIVWITSILIKTLRHH